MRVPAELTDRIIDFLHQDYSALAVCSLVCKTWLPSSRYHAFESIFISFDNVSGFIDLLEAPASTIAKYASTLHIANHCSEISMFLKLMPYLDGPLKVTSLEFSDSPCGAIQVGKQHDDNGSLSRSFARITHLYLDFEFERFHQFFDTIASFPSLETLIVHFSYELEDDDTNHLVPFYFPPHLRTIRFVLDQRYPTLPWLIPIARFPPIGKLELTRISEEELYCIQHLLRSFGPSIHTLLLNFDIPDMGKIASSIDLTLNTHLRSLCISGIPIASKDRAEERRCLADVLSQVTSFHLSRLDLVIANYDKPVDRPDKHCVDWNRLSQVLERPRFAQLESVHIILPQRMPYRTQIQLHSRMPSVANRGILKVSYYYEFSYSNFCTLYYPPVLL